MKECELLKTCVFFNDHMKDMKETADIFIRKFCRGDNGACARYIMAEKVGRKKVPSNLFPNDLERAYKLISLHLGEG